MSYIVVLHVECLDDQICVHAFGISPISKEREVFMIPIYGHQNTIDVISIEKVAPWLHRYEITNRIKKLLKNLINHIIKWIVWKLK